MIDEICWVLIFIIIFILLLIALYSRAFNGQKIIEFFRGGGEINGVNWDQIEILHELGSGAFGDVSAVKYNGIMYALKREKVLPKKVNSKGKKLSLKPSRELKFYNFIESLPATEQKYFIRLQGHRVVTCTHVHTIPHYLQKMFENNPHLKKLREGLEKSPYCAEYLMEFGGTSLKSMIDKMMDKNSIDYPLMQNVTVHVLSIIKILRAHKYVIDDLHSGNITVLANGNVKLIDYEEIKNIEIDKYMQRNFDTNRDLMSLIGILMNGGYFWINYLSTVDKLPPITEHIAFIRKIPGAWEKLTKYITIIDKNAKIAKTINKINSGVSLDNKSVIREIDQRLGPYLGTLFAILYEKEDMDYWRKATGINIPNIPLLIPQEDLVYILDNYWDIDSLISYFSAKKSGGDNDKIIHIAGSPGSGKTTLGEKLAALYPDKIAVKDTDEFIQHNMPSGQKLREFRESKDYDTYEYERMRTKIIDNAVNEFIAQNPNKIIVFTGLMDHFGPRDRNVLYEFKNIYKRFYLDIPIAKLLEQYYTRVCKEATMYPIWEQMAANIRQVDSTYQIINGEKDIKEKHLKLDQPYELATQEQILDYFAKLIKK